MGGVMGEAKRRKQAEQQAKSTTPFSLADFARRGPTVHPLPGPPQNALDLLGVDPNLGIAVIAQVAEQVGALDRLPKEEREEIRSAGRLAMASWAASVGAALGKKR